MEVAVNAEAEAVLETKANEREVAMVIEATIEVVAREGNEETPLALILGKEEVKKEKGTSFS